MKAGHNFDHERAARVLASAAFEGDTKAAQREGITVRTVQNYRRRLASDPRLSQLFADKKATLETEWAHDIAPTIRCALAFIQRAAEALNPGDPNAVHAMAGALKLVNEAGLALRVIDARLGDDRRPTNQSARSTSPVAPHTVN